MKNKTVAEVGKKMSLLLKARDFSQTDIASKTKISRVSLNRFLHAQSELRLSDFLAILKILDVDLDKILAAKLEEDTGGASRAETKFKNNFGDDIEFVLGRMSKLGKKSYLGHIIAHADLLGTAIPKPIYNRLKNELELL